MAWAACANSSRNLPEPRPATLDDPNRNMSELLADWAAEGLSLPRPSDYIPQPKRRTAQPSSQEATDYSEVS